jgi:hypothetical protein
MLDHRVGDAPHESPPYPAQSPATHDDEARSYLFSNPNDLLVFSPPPKMGFLDGPPALLDLPHLVVEYLLSFLANRLACLFIGFPTQAGFVHRVGRVWVPGAYVTTCSWEFVLFARSMAVLRASSASWELSVANRIFVGKMLICAFILGWFKLY